MNEAGGTGARDEKNHYSAGKTANESINNNDMSNKKSIFDKLYEEVLGGDDDDLEMGAGFDAFGDEGMEDDELGGGEDEVTLSLPRDVAQQLCDMLKAELGEGDDEEIEDIEDTEDMEELDEYSSDEDDEEEVMQEAPEHQEIGDAGPGGADIDKGGLKGKNNKVSGTGSAHKVTSTGHGDGKLKGGNPEPTDLGDKSGALTGKNNKVPGKIHGKGQELFG